VAEADPTNLVHPAGRVRLERRDGGRTRLRVEMNDPRAFVAHRTWETSYPIALIERILALKGPAYLCDEIMREEDPHYVARQVRFGILGYVPAEALAARRVLDFGCGSGASVMALARANPRAEIVGVELNASAAAVAEERARHYRLGNVRIVVSPHAAGLPEDLGTFDYVALNAVYEHLLPAERSVLLAALWGALQQGGVLFVNQTPERWFPLEWHTTGLPLIAYLPDRAAFAVARRFSRRVRPEQTWEGLLRAGIRGGSVREIQGLLRACPGRAVLLPPVLPGARDRIDLWYRSMASMGRSPAMRLYWWFARALRACTGITLLPVMSIALRKEAGGSVS
jgi:2-polyprenyl-3-methyl-5-hydroxy-6-metoxy-1,4-benzoquinol methylase